MWTELFAMAVAYLQTPQGMAMIGSLVLAGSQFLHAKGINVPAITPIINWLHSITGGQLIPVGPTPSPTPPVGTGHPLIDFLLGILTAATPATVNQTVVAVKATVADFEASEKPPVPLK